MPLSYQTHSVSSSASGSGLQFSVTYSFLLKAHVKLYYGLDILAGTSTSLLVDGVDYNWTSSTQVTLTSAPSSNQTLTIIRDTPDSTQQVVWQDGSNLIADDMNTADKQNLFVVQEQQDRNDLAATKAIDSETASNAATTAVNQAVLADGTRAMTGNLNVDSNKVVNLANPTAGGDAVNKTFADASYQPLDAELTELATMASNTAAALADLTQAEVNILDGATVSTSELNTLDGVTASTAELNKLDGVTSSTAELNILDGVTATASELNALDGITASTTELNKLDGVTASTAELNTVDGVTSAIQTQLDGKQPLDAELTELATMPATTASALADLTEAEVQVLDGATLSTAELNTLDGITATAAELNVLDGSSATTADLNKLSAVSATSAELNKLDGITSSTSELNILDGVTATAAELNVADGITASTAELNQLDGKTISSTLTPANTNDIPTSSAVNTFVSGLLNALGGFVAIANENSFPTTNPDPSDNAGTVVSIADAGGMSVNSSGVGSGQTTAGTAVTITGFPSTFNGTTIQAGLGLQVQTTSTLNTYTYHKVYAKDEDVRQLSQDVDDFKARYRVGDSNPTTDLDAGDLFFNRGTGKMLVYNGQNTAWEEVQSIGEFFINTLSASTGTGGGSATFNGTAYRFTLSNPPTNAEQLLVSVNGVVQKPNSGTSQPSEGFAIDSTDIIFAAAPATSAPFFIVTIGSSVNIGTPSAGTVGTAQLATSAVTNDKISSTAAIASSKLAKPIDFADNEKARFGASQDLEIYHDSNASFIDDVGTGDLRIRANNLSLRNTSDVSYLYGNSGGAVTLYFNGAPKLATKSDGIDVTGEVQCDTLDVDGTSNFDGQISVTGALELRRSSADICLDVGQTGVGNKARINADGTATFSGRVICSGGTTSTNALQISGDNNSAKGIEFYNAGGSLKASIKLDGAATFDGKVTLGATHAGGEVLEVGKSSGGSYMSFHSGGTHVGFVGFADQLVVGGASNEFAIRSQADLLFATSGNTERARITANGLTFNGDTASANALSDYEEGTSNTSVNAITASTNSVQMKYVKVGNLVTVVGVITLVGITSSSSTNGNFNLPFTPTGYSTSVPGADIQRNDIDTSTKYLGTYGANPQVYFNSEGGGYRSTNNLTQGKIGFTITYTTF